MTAIATKTDTTATANDVRPMCGAIKVNGKRCKVFVSLADSHDDWHVPTKDDSIRISAYDFGRTPLRYAFDGVQNDAYPYPDYIGNDRVIVRPGDRNYDVAFATYVKTAVHEAKIMNRGCELNFGAPHNKLVGYLQKLNEIKL